MKARNTAMDSGSNQPLSNSPTAGRADLSILRKPIQTTITGFQEVIKAYEDGTDELRKLLANECDIIYECRACRNIFRSLANFISHKRIYCKSNFNTAHHFHFRTDGGDCIDQDVATIVQADLHNYDNHVTTVIGGGPAAKPVKDLASIIERLVQKEQTGRLMNLSDFYQQAAEKVALEKQKQTQPVLQLESVSDCRVAVFQTVKEEGAITGDSIKQEVQEVFALSENKEATVDENGKAVLAEVAGKSIVHGCDICKATFGTEKTLRLHIKSKHISSTYVFSCPSCSQTYSQPSAVIKHLINDHKKSTKRTRLMREGIFKRGTRIDEVPVKAPNRELARLQMDAKERGDSQSRNWPDNYSGNGEMVLDKGIASAAAASSTVTSECTYCAKTFERRATLISHVKTCPAKSNGRITRNNNNAALDGSRPSSIDRDDDSSGSAESFLAMLNREKLIQTMVQNQDISQPISSCDNIKEELKLDCVPIELSEATNKRKRNRARKTAPLSTASLNCSEEISWAVDDEISIADGRSNEKSMAPPQLSIKLELDSVASVINSVSMGGDCTVYDPIEDGDVLAETIEAPIKSKKPKPNEIEKTTDCTICSKKFANISNLRRHVSMFHYREKKFGCKLCEFKAFRKVDIVNHLRSQHSIELDDKESALEYVILIEIDKNKYNDEKVKAIADALIKQQEREEQDCEESKIANEELSSHPDIIIPLLSTEELDTVSVESVLDDIVQLDDDMAAELNGTTAIALELDDFSNESVGDAIKRRAGRPKNTTPKVLPKFAVSTTPVPCPTTNTVDPPSKPSKATKLSRHSSSNSSSSEETSRRPVRNRIKTVNKDFVYDLSDLIKKEAEAYKEQQPVHQKAQKRKMAQVLAASIIDQNGSSDMIAAATNNSESVTTVVPEEASKRPQMEIKGAAQTMATQAVLNGRARFHQPPVIPSERPIVPAKIIALRPTVNHTQEWQVLQHDSQCSLSDSSAVDDGIPPKRRRCSNEKLYDALTKKKQLILLDKLNKTRSASIPGPGKSEATANTHSDVALRLQVRSSISTLPNGSSADVDSKIVVKCATEDEFHYLVANSLVPPAPTLQPKKKNLVSSSRRSSSSSSSGGGSSLTVPPSPSSNTKRISVLQRLAENKTKKIRENMMRLSISGDGSGVGASDQ